MKQNPISPDFVDPYICDQFEGIQTQTTRPGVDDKKLAWCDGFYPLSAYNLRTMYGVGSSIYTAPAGTSIVFYQFGNIGSTPYCIVFLNTGRIDAVNTNTLAVTNIAPPNTISNPSQLTVGMKQWGNQYIIICSTQTNGYFIWDGTLFYTAGTLAPETIIPTFGGSYSTTPTVTAVGGAGVNTSFSVSINPTAQIIAVQVINGGAYDSNVPPPTITITGGGGTSAILTPNMQFNADTAFWFIGSVTITDGGENYTSNPTIGATGGVPSGSPFFPVASLTASVGTVSEIISIGIINPGNGYLASDQVTLVFTGGNPVSTFTASMSTSYTLALMPYALQGNALETYAGRVWIASKNSVFFTGPGSVYNISTTIGGGEFTSSDSFLRVSYNQLIQTNGFLYLIGDSSVNYISGVQTTGTPPVTTFNNQNADPEVGSPWPNTVDVWGQNIVMANTWGAQVSYGSRVTKISEDLDGIYNSVGNTFGTFIPSAAKANMFGKKVWMMLLPIVDPILGQQVNKLLMWNGKFWWTSQQDQTLQYIASQEINAVLTAYGTDGTNIWPLFQNPSANFLKAFRTKQWMTPMGYQALKAAVRFWGIFKPNNLTVDTATLSIDSESGSTQYSLTFAGAGIPVFSESGFSDIEVFNRQGAQIEVVSSPGFVPTVSEVTTTLVSIPVVNALNQVIPVESVGILLVQPGQAIAQTGVLLGWTLETNSEDVQVISTMVQPEHVGYRG